MNASQPFSLFMNPWLIWSRLAWKTGEMAVASAQVIGHRASRLGIAGAVPSARDQRELALMGREKGEALLESSQAVWGRMLAMNQQYAVLAFKQMLATSAALMSITASRTPAESVARQSKLVRDTMMNSAVAASRLSGSAARIAQSAARPVHTRVSGNVRRLRRPSR